MKPDGVRKKNRHLKKFSRYLRFSIRNFFHLRPLKRMSRIRFEHLKTRKRRAAAYAVSRCCARLVK